MSYNHERARKRFEKKWKKLWVQYREAGMSEENIKKMYDYDLAVLNSERSYLERTDYIEPSEFDPREDCGSKLPTEKISVTDERSVDHSRYWWVEEIEDPRISAYLKRLSKLDLEILTCYAFEGLDQKSIAEKIGRNQQFVSREIVRIRQTLKFLKKNE